MKGPGLLSDPHLEGTTVAGNNGSLNINLVWAPGAFPRVRGFLLHTCVDSESPGCACEQEVQLGS